MELNTNKESLEKALSKTNLSVEVSKKQAENLNKEEEIGFHKGALNTLVAERNELIKMIGNIEAIMQAHIKRLEELGVKIEAQKK